jgi:hypothetical protein
MVELLLSLIFGIHLLAVDIAMAGPLLAVWLRWRVRRLEPVSGSRELPPEHKASATDQLGRRVAAWSLAAAALGVVLGLVALVLVPHAEAAPYGRALNQLPAARWWFVAAEVVFYFITLGAYYLLWRRLERRPLLHGALAVAAATDLIYHFPPLFAVVSTLSLRPNFWDVPLDHALYWRLLLEGDTLSRVIHYWLAAWAVGATGVMLLTLRSFAETTIANPTAVSPTDPSATSASAGGPSADPNGIRWRAARIALMVSLVQLPVGVWVVCELPLVVQSQLLGEDILSTALFGVSLVAALGLMHHLAMIALGDGRRGATLRAAGLMMATVLLMVAALHRARHQAFAQMSLPAPTGVAR